MISISEGKVNHFIDACAELASIYNGGKYKSIINMMVADK
jgi:hypothetical protein